jgi:heterogeneous nuclear ribonucleoprotein F/H
MQETHQGNVWSASGVHATPSQVLRTPLIQDPTKNAGKQSGGMQHPGYSKGASSGGRAGRGPGENTRQKGAGRGSGRGGGIQVGEHTGFLRMRGLPFTATKGEIFEFFKKYEPVEDSICLTFRSDGRATGEGYIAFGKADDAKDAMALHRNTMGNRYIELFISNKEEHGRALAREAMTPLR